MPMSRRRKPLVVKKKQNPLSEVQEAAESYAELSQNYNEAAEGYRLRLYEFAARCYWIGLAFARSPASYQQFMSDVFWNDVRQKPKGDEVMKAVLTFAMKAKSKNLRNRVTKTAAVLESFDQLEVKAEHVVVARLKAGGGIEKMYREISGKYKDGSALPDDLDLLKPAPPEDDDQPGDADEEQTENSEEESDEGWGDSPLSAKEASESDHRSEQAPSRAVSDSITITDFGGQATPPTAPPLGKRFDPDKHLAVEMDPSTLAWVLGVQQRILIEAVVGPRDEWGWRSVKAENVGRAYPPAEPGSSSEIDDEDA